MEHNKILIIVRRGVAEIEWIMPVLNYMHLRNDIYLIYLTKKSYLNCLNSSFYISYSKILKNFFVMNYNFNFFARLFLKISRGNIKDFFFNKFYDVEKIKKKLQLSTKDKINLVITEFGNNSEWINKFRNDDGSKIIKVPSTPSSYVNYINKKVKKINCDYLIVNTHKDLKYWSRFVDKNKIRYFGVPFFNKKIKKKVIKQNNPIKVLFAYSSYFGIAKKDDFENLKKQLIEIIKFLSEMKNIEVSIKVHPHKNDPFYLNIINENLKNYKIYENKNLTKLVEINDLVITNYESAPAIYSAFFKKPGIEIWKASKFIFDNNFSKSNNDNLGIVVSSRNIKEFKKNFYLAIDSLKGKKNIFDQKYKNFENLYMKKKNTINKITNFLNNLND